MAETYTIAVTGAAADNDLSLQTQLTVGDSVARPAAAQTAMQTNTRFLCKGNDGSVAWYTYDSTRSVPGGPYYLLRV